MTEARLFGFLSSSIHPATTVIVAQGRSVAVIRLFCCDGLYTKKAERKKKYQIYSILFGDKKNMPTFAVYY